MSDANEFSVPIGVLPVARRSAFLIRNDDDSQVKCRQWVDADLRPWCARAPYPRAKRAEVTIGNPADHSVTIGPLASLTQREDVRG